MLWLCIDVQPYSQGKQPFSFASQEFRYQTADFMLVPEKIVWPLDRNGNSGFCQQIGQFQSRNLRNLRPAFRGKSVQGQQEVERGFRFLKDKSFRVAEVYLKKEERIEALAMIMVLTLMIYSIAEWLIRKRMRETGVTVPNQLKKPTQKPTFKWIAFLFMGVAEVTVWINGEMHLKIANMNDNLIKIVRLLGRDCEKYYGLEG